MLMASLTQGVLLKLLQHASDADVKVTGEHRSALLQVIEIVPALAGGDDPWQSRGFFLKVSDSLHSAYVSISDEDVDLIFSDKIQLGQFLHVSRLDSGSPLPVLRGVKPVPKRRPCVGNPTELVSSDSLPLRACVDLSTLRRGSEKGKKKLDSKVKVKKMEVVDVKSRRASLENGRVEGMELRRLSLDSMRRGWDQSPGLKNRSKSKETSSSPDSASVLSETRALSRTNSSMKNVLSEMKALSRTNSSMKNICLSASPLKSKNNVLQLKMTNKPLKKDIKLPNEISIPSHLSKLPISVKTWSEQNILWDFIPSSIHDLGKDVVHHRNCSFLAAVDALNEASAAESVIQCMSVFAEICESSQKESAGFLVGQFLKLHQNMQRAATTIDSLLKSRLSESKTSSSSPEGCQNFTNKNAASWVQAALESDLSNFSLFRKKDEKETIHSEQHRYVILENTCEATKMMPNNHSTQNKQSPKNQGGFPDSSAKGPPFLPKQRIAVAKRTNAERGELLKGSRLREAASLAKRLLLVSRGWFLNYLEESLNEGFGLRKGDEDTEIASLLGQLKRVNKWLEDATRDGSEVNERIESLRKKLYEFLLEHVDSIGIPDKQRKS